MIKWIETGDEDYPRVPLKLTMLGFKKVQSDTGLSDMELIGHITPSMDVSHELIQLLWTAIDYGQTNARTVVFKDMEEFALWAWLSIKSVTVEDIEGLEGESLEKFYADIPIIKVLQSVINDLEDYMAQLTKKQRKNVQTSHQVMVEDHS